VTSAGREIGASPSSKTTQAVLAAGCWRRRAPPTEPSRRTHSRALVSPNSDMLTYTRATSTSAERSLAGICPPVVGIIKRAAVPVIAASRAQFAKNGQAGQPATTETTPLSRNITLSLPKNIRVKDEFRSCR
jgi:hypothetical protein